MNKLFYVLLFSVLALGLAYILGLRTFSETHSTYECTYTSSKICSSVRLDGNPFGSLYYITFSLVFIVSLTRLLLRQFGHNASGRISIITLLLFVLNMLVMISERGAYQFASMLMFTYPPFLIFVIISTLVYVSYRLKVRSGVAIYERSATVLFLLLWTCIIGSFLVDAGLDKYDAYKACKSVYIASECWWIPRS
jgi:hypothetical protein